MNPEIALALLSSDRGQLMADLLVRGVEAEHRPILAAALLTPPRRNLAELLAAIPDVGLDADFDRQDNTTGAVDVFG